MRKEIPPEDRWRQARARKRPPAHRERICLALIHECLLVRSRCVRLPERHDVHPILELPAENSRVQWPREDLSRLPANREEPVLRTIAANPVPKIRKWTKLPATLVPH